MGPVMPVGPVGNVNGGTGGNVGPIELGFNAAPRKLSCESNGFPFDIIHLQYINSLLIDVNCECNMKI
ncbi:hypothetical protein [Bacillus wiedmannii]|uniref:hypothetical protein n=1 Tax=Bacillus wiedmannii TaxID=1890302 RepID=UPI00211DEFC7|nr:hypothetical protein [Bacillus wiedmannii]